MTLPSGRGAREYGKFRETRRGKTAIAVINEDEARVETFNITASGNTKLLSCLTGEDSIRIMGVTISNADNSTVLVSLRGGSSGDKKFTNSLGQNKRFHLNLHGRYWRLPVGEDLYINTDGSTDLYVTIQYLDKGEAEEEQALTDSQSIAESLAIKPSTALTDSQSIAEGIDKADVVKGNSDSLEPTESLTVSNFVKDLTDSESIAESVETYEIEP